MTVYNRIIQIAGNDFGIVFDTKSIYKNNKIRNRIEKLFLKNNFIGFTFYNDVNKIGEFFKKIVYRNNFIELSKVYFEIKKKKAPDLKAITLELFKFYQILFKFLLFFKMEKRLKRILKS